jgi:ABC-type multidrug transport system fused ATPase/permease subunit
MYTYQRMNRSAQYTCTHQNKHGTHTNTSSSNNLNQHLATSELYGYEKIYHHALISEQEKKWSESQWQDFVLESLSYWCVLVCPYLIILGILTLYKFTYSGSDSDSALEINQVFISCLLVFVIHASMKYLVLEAWPLLIERVIDAAERVLNALYKVSDSTGAKSLCFSDGKEKNNTQVKKGLIGEEVTEQDENQKKTVLIAWQHANIAWSNNSDRETNIQTETCTNKNDLHRVSDEIGALSSSKVSNNRVYSTFTSVSDRQLLREEFEQTDIESCEESSNLLNNTSLSSSPVSLVSPPRWILQDVNLSINQGEVVAIVGDAKVGKSSLLKSMLQLPGLQILSGSIAMSCSSNSRVMLCEQIPWILHHATVRENITLSSTMSESELERERDKERLTQALSAVDLDPSVLSMSASLYCHSHHGLCRRRSRAAQIQLARAIYSNTEIVLMDFPV